MNDVTYLLATVFNIMGLLEYPIKRLHLRLLHFMATSHLKEVFVAVYQVKYISSQDLALFTQTK